MHASSYPWRFRLIGFMWDEELAIKAAFRAMSQWGIRCRAYDAHLDINWDVDLVCADGLHVPLRRAASKIPVMYLDPRGGRVVHPDQLPWPPEAPALRRKLQEIFIPHAPSWRNTQPMTL
ncbi:MAG: hypothetical protein Q8N17_04875 [Burkholderiaceae bacterium]|nr:hypothetical protein [Burkholderiaceae bacterium]